MRSPKVKVTEDGRVLVERFTPLRRVEHWLAMITFTVLIVTGLPQMFRGDVSLWIITKLGGLDQVRSIHRIVGLVFVGHMVAHLTGLFAGVMLSRVRMSMLPTPKDLADAWANLGHMLGFRSDPPRYAKFDYQQKFEYVGILLGGLVMVTSGLVLMFPLAATAFLPGQVIPAARAAHSYEALLALSVLLIWHLYGAHLSPEVFPMNKSIFTGYLDARDLRERHALEYDRVFPDGEPKVPSAATEAPTQTEAPASPGSGRWQRAERTE